MVDAKFIAVALTIRMVISVCIGYIGDRRAYLQEVVSVTFTLSGE